MAMTFGEKLYQLRKAHGLSQEELAEKLNTSRQAVSKWENNHGYPETEKIILIGKLFHVNLDDLLMDEKELALDGQKTGSGEGQESYARETGAKEEFYVNRETANGFLLYYKKKFMLLAVACGIVLGCNAVSYSSTEYSFFASAVLPALTSVSVMLMLAVVIYIALEQNPYRKLRKKDFVFAEEVRREIEEEFQRMKKALAGGIVLGLILFWAGGSGWELGFLESVEMDYGSEIASIVASMVLTGIGGFLTFFCIGVYWSYSVLLRDKK